MDMSALYGLSLSSVHHFYRRMIIMTILIDKLEAQSAEFLGDRPRGRRAKSRMQSWRVACACAWRFLGIRMPDASCNMYQGSSVPKQRLTWNDRVGLVARKTGLMEGQHKGNNQAGYCRGVPWGSGSRSQLSTTHECIAAVQTLRAIALHCQCVNLHCCRSSGHHRCDHHWMQHCSFSAPS